VRALGILRTHISKARCGASGEPNPLLSII
jgi:hypothetical protein